MKFKVGDFLVDAGNDPTDKLMSATVIDFIDNDTGKYYRLQYHQGFDDWLEAEEVEYEWEKAPIGSVGWLIHELSKHDPTDSVSICQWNTNGWKVDVKDVEIINKFGEGAVTLW